ncbi:MAG: HAD family hydrolase [Culicoidibacterales bacterium]
MNKQKITFITDLDHTIIHSKNPDHICVEWHEDQQPITYMTETSIAQFQQILKTEWIEVIPCTMRNKYQVTRISWFQTEMPTYVICTNGAQIYIDGVLDSEWEQFMRSEIDYEQVIKNQVQVENLMISNAIVQNIEGFYLVVKVAEMEDVSAIYTQMKAMFGDTHVVFETGRKVFIIDPKIDKKYAVEYLRAKYGFQRLITSGDSKADQLFTTCGQAILPKHATFVHNTAILTEKSGIYATDEILAYVLSYNDH